MGEKIKVMMATEGTYPFHQGGVSVWCDLLINKLPDIDFTVFSVIMNPYVTQKFSLPENASLIKVPLWGTEEPSEHLTTPFSKIYLSKKMTTDKAISKYFIPYFKILIEDILSVKKDPEKFGDAVFGLYNYFQKYEYKKSFKSQVTWNIYKELTSKYIIDAHNKLPQAGVYSMIQTLLWVYRFFNIINTPVPYVNVAHATAAAFCGIPCVVSKMQNKTTFLLTEHGVYLREQYLSLSQRKYSSFMNTFLIRMVQSVVSVNYHFADQVSPVCEYNTKWEEKLGVDKKKIKVIYNGVEKSVFLSSEASVPKTPEPTVVMTARIDPIKDIITMIRAAALVKRDIPNVKFIVYGSVTVPIYKKECEDLIKELGLTETFILAGHTSNVAAAYKSGDVVALSSISEAFPYSVIEAMLSGKPVVATDVGGVAEALGDTGFLVNPMDYQQMATSLLKLLMNPSLRYDMGEEARQRALNLFTIGNFLQNYMKTYISLSMGILNYEEDSHKAGSLETQQQQILIKGYALLKMSHYTEAIEQFRLAIEINPEAISIPIILLSIAEAYEKLGMHKEAELEITKANLLTSLLNQNTA